MELIVFDDPRGNLGVLTLIIQKSTVIPPYPMVLFIEEQQEKLNLESIKSLRRFKSESTANRI